MLDKYVSTCLNRFIHTYILRIYILPLQQTNSEALHAYACRYKNSLTSFINLLHSVCTRYKLMCVLQELVEQLSSRKFRVSEIYEIDFVVTNNFLMAGWRSDSLVCHNKCVNVILTRSAERGRVANALGPGTQYTANIRMQLQNTCVKIDTTNHGPRLEGTRPCLSSRSQGHVSRLSTV